MYIYVDAIIIYLTESDVKPCSGTTNESFLIRVFCQVSREDHYMRNEKSLSSLIAWLVNDDRAIMTA